MDSICLTYMYVQVRGIDGQTRMSVRSFFLTDMLFCI